MRYITLIMLIAVSFMLTGCVLEDIIEENFGWIRELALHPTDAIIAAVGNWWQSLWNEKPQQAEQQAPAESSIEQNRVENLPAVQQPQCPSKEHWDYNQQKCVCDSGYARNSAGDCVRTGGCTFDSECGGSTCEAGMRKQRRCNLLTYTCYTETINCKDYGQNYVCSNGQCVQKIVK